MDDFIRQPREERRVYFEQTAARLRLSPQIIEKDFWVCWTLKELFGLPEIGTTLIFKGGTSLSKVYRMIERFSEDIDVSLDRASLGFGGGIRSRGRRERQGAGASAGPVASSMPGEDRCSPETGVRENHHSQIWPGRRLVGDRR